MAELRKLTRARLLGGEITLPARSGVSALASGGRLDRQSVFTILPLLSPAEQIRLAQSQIDADGQVEQAKVQVHATRQVQNRAEQMRRDKVGTERAVEDARVQVKLAVAALHTAQAHRNLLGPALLSTASPAEVWVRVPVYVGDLAKLDSSAEARIGGLGDAPGAAGRAARPVSAPPSTNAMVSTVDVFYQVANRDGAYRFGQRVGVTIPLRESQAGVVVPWSAIVHDAQGGTWVYEQSAPLVYVRRRVLVERVAGDLAVLAGGLKPGTSVVVSGAAELFGTEFGAGK
ncbi:MAG: membrane fusion protein MtrC [Pseudomonadota bacterium]